MRVISGKYKGRKIEGYEMEGTRPTMDRIKESLFAMVDPYIKNSDVLDLFAGTGSLGIESLSRGSLHCTFADQNRIAIQTINKTIKNIKMEESIEVIYGDYQKVLQQLKDQNKSFDIIFLDPPYFLHIINSILKQINEYNLLNENGIIVCEYEGEKIISEDYAVYKEKKYGSKKVKVYRMK